MAQESLEDRIALAGKHDEFSAAIGKFKKSRKNRNDQFILYEKLESLGASGEEADEYVNLMLDDE